MWEKTLNFLGNHICTFLLFQGEAFNILGNYNPLERCCNILPYLGFFKGLLQENTVACCEKTRLFQFFYYIAVARLICLNHEKVAKV